MSLFEFICPPPLPPLPLLVELFWFILREPFELLTWQLLAKPFIESIVESRPLLIAQAHTNQSTVLCLYPFHRIHQTKRTAENGLSGIVFARWSKYQNNNKLHWKWQGRKLWQDTPSCLFSPCPSTEDETLCVCCCCAHSSFPKYSSNVCSNSQKWCIPELYCRSRKDKLKWTN